MELKLTHADVNTQVKALANAIRSATTFPAIYPIPRGGVPVAYALLSCHLGAVIVDKPEEATVFVDDIVDTGDTMRRYCDEYPGKPFFALVNKDNPNYKNKWIVFPWEQGEDNKDESVTDNIVRLLQFVGEDPKREGLQETPQRVIKAWRHWASGYNIDIASILKVFEDGGENYDEMVLVKHIPIYSKCEHHLADIFGTASIAYIPDGRIVGLSKLSRLADVFARRLQVQERLTTQIADALDEHLKPKGVGVIIRARHMCMESRGICQQGHYTVTSALRGVLKTDAAARSEFMKLAS
jgi:GTP cyclohydrolase I